MEEYAVVCEGNGLRMFLRNKGIVNFSSEMLERAAQKRKEIEQRKAAGENVWNSPKASVLSVAGIGEIISVGYGLWTPDNNRVDYALASVSRGETKGFDDPMDMYTKGGDGTYVKNNNDQTNALGAFALTVLDPDKRTPTSDLEVLLVRRGKNIDFLKDTWTLSGGYTEPGDQIRLYPTYMHSEVEQEIVEEAGIVAEEIRTLMLRAFLQDRYETALLYVAIANIGWQDIKDRKPKKDIDQREAVRISELDDFVNAHIFDAHALGALKEVVNTERLIEELPRYRA